MLVDTFHLHFRKSPEVLALHNEYAYTLDMPLCPLVLESIKLNTEAKDGSYGVHVKQILDNPNYALLDLEYGNNFVFFPEFMLLGMTLGGMFRYDESETKWIVTKEVVFMYQQARCNAMIDSKGILFHCLIEDCFHLMSHKKMVCRYIWRCLAISDPFQRNVVIGNRPYHKKYVTTDEFSVYADLQIPMKYHKNRYIEEEKSWLVLQYDLGNEGTVTNQRA